MKNERVSLNDLPTAPAQGSISELYARIVDAEIGEIAAGENALGA